MATAFMVAYVADGTPLSDLEVSELRTADGVEFGRTEHARAFDVMDAPAGPIELWHAWLRTET